MRARMRCCGDGDLMLVLLLSILAIDTYSGARLILFIYFQLFDNLPFSSEFPVRPLPDVQPLIASWA